MDDLMGFLACVHVLVCMRVNEFIRFIQTHTRAINDERRMVIE